MRPKAAINVAAVVATLFLLSAPAVTFAASSQTLALGLAGGFVDIGSQRYTSTGSAASYISVMGGPDLSTAAKFGYSIDASVQGLSVSGHAQFHLTSAGSEDSQIRVEAQARLVEMVPAISFPYGCDTVTPSHCTSAVPGFFVGDTTIIVKIGDKSQVYPDVPILFESAYLNPFHGPVYIGAPGVLTIVSGVDTAISKWNNIQTGGSVFDNPQNLGNPIGMFSMVSSSVENLVQGTEEDHGQIVLSGFGRQYSLLNSAGSFHGKSWIPRANPGVYDCSAGLTAGLGITLPAGTSICVMTGSHSTGSFNLSSRSAHARIQGSYDTTWLIPAVGFTSVVQATLKN